MPRGKGTRRADRDGTRRLILRTDPTQSLLFLSTPPPLGNDDDSKPRTRTPRDMETRVFCVELKMGPSGHMDSTGIFPDSNTREFGPRRTTQRQPPRPTHKCNAPRLPFHVHLTHDLTRAASALPLHTAALAFVSFGIVLVQVQVQVFLKNRGIFGQISKK